MRRSRAVPVVMRDRRGRRTSAAGGFSLAEVLIATAILAGGLLAVAQLFVVATRSNVEAMHATRAVLLASQKIETLRACCGATATASSPDALHADTPGFVEYIDRRGHPLDDGPPPPAGTVYVRRWSIQPLASYPDAAILVQVLVTPHRGSVPPGAATGLRPGEARLVALLAPRLRSP